LCVDVAAGEPTAGEVRGVGGDPVRTAVCAPVRGYAAPVRDREPQPTFVPPMLLTAGSVPDGEQWALELKWDGCRAQIRFDGRNVTLRTRHGRECSAEFPELSAIADVLRGRRVTLDGELVCLREDGWPDFARLRRRLAGHGRNPPPATLQVFDVLHLDGRSTRFLPYRERRGLLEDLALDGLAWRTPASLALDRSDAFVAGVAELGLEGVVAKRLDSRYTSGRRAASWIKHKLRRDEQLAVTGVRRRPDGKTEAVFVARRRPDGSVRSAGSIELGLRPDLLRALDDRLAELPARRRGAVAWYPAEVSVVASCHGLLDGPVRDAVLHSVL
jgi:bifunctional non-homologous end joining protein LigD